jgi:hypothetical protein
MDRSTRPRSGDLFTDSCEGADGPSRRTGVIRRLSRIRGRDLVGRYLFGDYCSGRLFAFRPRPGRRAGKQRSFRFKVPYLTSFGQDNQGRIYVLPRRASPSGVSPRPEPSTASTHGAGRSPTSRR